MRSKITNKSQISIINDQNWPARRVLNFDPWCLFVICHLKFIFIDSGFLQLCRFYKASLFRHFFTFVDTGPQRLDDPGTGFPGIDDFMDRVVGGEHLSHRHDAEVFLQDA